MSNPWDTIDDHSMQLIICELLEEHTKYKKAKKAAMFWLLISYFPLLALVYLFYRAFSYNFVNLMNLFSSVMGNKTILIVFIIYLGLAARVKFCMETEKEAKKDYKEIRAQVTDNFNNIWRYNYDMTKCNEIVRVLNKDHKINISYKG